MNRLSTIFKAAVCGGALLALGLSAAQAQTIQVQVGGTVYDNPYCGDYQNGVWVPNGNCGPGAPAVTPARVSGTIIAVKGHLVTLQQSNRQIVINDQPALDMRATGRVAVGRVVEAYGYWRAGTFFATSVEDEPASK